MQKQQRFENRRQGQNQKPYKQPKKEFGRKNGYENPKDQADEDEGFRQLRQNKQRAQMMEEAKYARQHAMHQGYRPKFAPKDGLMSADAPQWRPGFGGPPMKYKPGNEWQPNQTQW